GGGGGMDRGLGGEGGGLEIGRGGFGMEPPVVDDSRVVSGADVEPRQFLVDESLPIPAVTWRQARWELRVSAFASGSRGDARTVVRYTVRNLTAQPLSLQLVLAVRPFQVNPPSQFLNLVGGASALRQIQWDG